MQFVLVIYHGTTPLPGTPTWDSLSKDQKNAAYADYATLNEMENLTPAPPLGLSEKAMTVRVENGSTVIKEGPYRRFGSQRGVRAWRGPPGPLLASSANTPPAEPTRLVHRTTRQCRRGGGWSLRRQRGRPRPACARPSSPLPARTVAAPGFMAASPVAAMRYRERLGHLGLG